MLTFFARHFSAKSSAGSVAHAGRHPAGRRWQLRNLTFVAVLLAGPILGSVAGQCDDYGPVVASVTDTTTNETFWGWNSPGEKPVPLHPILEQRINTYNQLINAFRALSPEQQAQLSSMSNEKLQNWLSNNGFPEATQGMNNVNALQGMGRRYFWLLQKAQKAGTASIDWDGFVNEAGSHGEIDALNQALIAREQGQNPNWTPDDPPQVTPGDLPSFTIDAVGTNSGRQWPRCEHCNSLTEGTTPTKELATKEAAIAAKDKARRGTGKEGKGGAGDDSGNSATGEGDNPANSATSEGDNPTKSATSEVIAQPVAPVDQSRAHGPTSRELPAEQPIEVKIFDPATGTWRPQRQLVYPNAQYEGNPFWPPVPKKPGQVGPGPSTEVETPTPPQTSSEVGTPTPPQKGRACGRNLGRVAGALNVLMAGVQGAREEIEAARREHRDPSVFKAQFRQWYALTVAPFLAAYQVATETFNHQIDAMVAAVERGGDPSPEVEAITASAKTLYRVSGAQSAVEGCGEAVETIKSFAEWYRDKQMAEQMLEKKRQQGSENSTNGTNAINQCQAKGGICYTDNNACCSKSCSDCLENPHRCYCR